MSAIIQEQELYKDEYLLQTYSPPGGVYSEWPRYDTRRGFWLPTPPPSAPPFGDSLSPTSTFSSYPVPLHPPRCPPPGCYLSPFPSLIPAASSTNAYRLQSVLTLTLGGSRAACPGGGGRGLCACKTSRGRAVQHSPLTFCPFSSTFGLFSISQRPSLKPFRLFGLPNLSLLGKYGKMSLGPKNALEGACESD